jgi:NAD(P)-dependent dehydrogenase (short-subunit alcohol dehydrogenase family)
MAELSGRNALVLGVERPAGRRAAVALAEAGADVAVVTLSAHTTAEFAANSTANEFWALGRKGVALTSDGTAASIRDAIAKATADLGPVSIFVAQAPSPLDREALAGLRSDPAIVVIIAEDDTPDAVRALLAWTRVLADSGRHRPDAERAPPTRPAGPASRDRLSLFRRLRRHRRCRSRRSELEC